MGLSQAASMAVTTACLGILSFIFGIVAENKKPAMGSPTKGTNGATICHYPHDPSIVLGSLSVVLLFFSSIAGVVAIFFPYNKKAVPVAALTKSAMLVVFSAVSVALFFVAEGLLMWATITEGIHRTKNVHLATTDCPTAKTGLLGGAAFLALDTTLFWLICQMLTMNVREDHFDMYDNDENGSYGAVTTSDYAAAGALHMAAKA